MTPQHLTPDPQRKWFIYFQQKEMGPLSESELKNKYAAGELDSTTYVYTEGMSDWALINDTSLLPTAPSPTHHTNTNPGPHSQSGYTNPGAQAINTNPGLRSGNTNPGTQVTNTNPAIQSGNSMAMEEELALLGLAEAEMNKESISAPAPVAKTTAAPKQVMPAAAEVTQQMPIETPDTPPPAAPKKLRLPSLSFKGKKLKPIYVVFLFVVVGALGMQLMVGGSPELSMFNPLLSALGLHKKAKAPPKAPPKNAGAPNKSQPPPRSPWADLEELRASSDPKSPPYRLSAQPLGGKKPVLTGALSGLVPAERLRVAIYPDATKNLMVIPKIWFFEIPVLDGYFSIGPLSSGGKDLPPGTYHVLLRLNDSFLGETSFDQWGWPKDPDLAKVRAQIQKERLLIADKEKAAIESKIGELVAATTELKKLGTALVPKKAIEWAKRSKSWSEKLNQAIDEQHSLLGGPMFYPSMQKEIYSYMSTLWAQKGALDLVAKGGTALLIQRKKVGLGQLWVQTNQKQAQLAGAASSLGPPNNELSAEPDYVKNRLMAGDSTK